MAVGLISSAIPSSWVCKPRKGQERPGMGKPAWQTVYWDVFLVRDS